jgi:hypothetical protein
MFLYFLTATLGLTTRVRAKKSVQILQFGLNDKPLSTIINLALADDPHFFLSNALSMAIVLQAIIFTLISMVSALIKVAVRSIYVIISNCWGKRAQIKFLYFSKCFSLWCKKRVSSIMRLVACC